MDRRTTMKYTRAVAPAAVGLAQHVQPPALPTTLAAGEPDGIEASASVHTSTAHPPPSSEQPTISGSSNDWINAIPTISNQAAPLPDGIHKNLSGLKMAKALRQMQDADPERLKQLIAEVEAATSKVNDNANPLTQKHRDQLVRTWTTIVMARHPNLLYTDIWKSNVVNTNARFYLRFRVSLMFSAILYTLLTSLTPTDRDNTWWR